MTTLDIVTDQDTRRELPRGWRWARLGEVCRVVSGSTPSSTVKEFWDGDIVWITPTDLGQLEGRDIFTSQRRITLTGYDNSGTELVPPDVVVMSSRAPIGHLGIARVPLCTNQGCKSFVPSSAVDPAFLYFALKRAVPELKALGSGATFAEVSKSQLEQFEISLPSLLEQRRIAAILAKQLAAVERARAATVERLEAARTLPAAYLRAVFESEEAQSWPRKRLGEINTLLPARSISTDGDTDVLAITTACLTESGFESAGVKKARMWASDAIDSKVSSGEILIARSNTAELVGRVALFEGEPRGAVASDLTIRIWPGSENLPAFLTAYLSYLYLTGYWKEKAGGASDSMKKITRSQLIEERVPIPALVRQEEIIGMLAHRMIVTRSLQKALQAQLAAIDKLPAALLRRAFNGEL